MTPLEQANIMCCARRIHKRTASTENWKLAVEMELAKDRDSAVKLCLSLGLYVNGAKGHTCIDKMTEYLNQLV